MSEINILLAVVDHGSFSAAARSLGCTPSAVGKRISQLEQRLRAPLLIRSTRHMRLTEPGRRYVEEARELLARMVSLEEDIADNAVHLRGRIRLTSSAALGRLHVVPLVIDFMARHEDVEIELKLTDRSVDLVGEGFDLAIRSGVLSDSSLISRKLMANRRVICAAPDYLARYGAPAGPEDLTRHSCLCLSQERQIAHWGFGRETVGTHLLGAGFGCNSLEALREACLAGQGIAWLPEFLVSCDLQEGRLTPLLEDAADPEAGGAIHILRPETTYLQHRVRAFIDFVADRFPPQADNGLSDPRSDAQPNA